MIVQAASVFHHVWLREQLGGAAFKGDVRMIEAVDETGKCHAMVAFDDFTLSAVRAYFASASLAGLKALLRPMFDYVFNQAKKILVTTYIPSHSFRMRRLAVKLGFRELASIPDGYDKHDSMIIFGMRREECRFLKGA